MTYHELNEAYKKALESGNEPDVLHFHTYDCIDRQSWNPGEFPIPLRCGYCKEITKEQFEEAQKSIKERGLWPLPD